MKTFKYTINNIELRSCNDSLLLEGEHTRAEIVQWDKGSCWTIGCFRKISNGYEFICVEDRVTDSEVNWVDLEILVKTGYKHLGVSSDY